MSGDFDYVIVGGGTAGCVLADRLTEDGKHTVLLLEGGGEGDNFLNRIPASSFMLIGNPSFDWIYPVETDSSIKDRVYNWTVARLLGGATGINGMVYLRGMKTDFDGWAEAGATGWDWDSLLPYFKKSEDFVGPDLPSHGHGGPLRVSPLPEMHELTGPFLQSCEALGIPILEDYCNGNQDGCFINFSTTRNGVRESARSSFLARARKRPNLTVRTHMLADKVTFDGARANGVDVIGPGGRETVRARREVILSCGALATPGVMLRSGLGPAAQLSGLGIEVANDLPGVGENLQEHCGASSAHEVDVPTYNNMVGPIDRIIHGTRWLLTHKGPLASIAVHAMAYGRSSICTGAPDIIINVIPIAIDATQAGIKPHKKSGITVGGCVARPYSRGRITLRDRDPAVRPVIEHRLLGDERDVRIAIDGCKLSEAIFQAPGLGDHFKGRITPLEMPRDDAEWEDYVRTHASIGYHPVGTCKIGSDRMAVVDPRLRVHGVTGLRIADASVMPNLVSGNTQAATYAIGEKAADMIRDDAARANA